MSKIRSWYEANYKGIWSEDVLENQWVVSEWLEHLKDSVPLPDVLKQAQHEEMMARTYNSKAISSQPQKGKNE